MAELVDALASGASVRKDVEVQVLSRAPNRDKFQNSGALRLFFVWFCGAKTKCFKGGEKNFGQPQAAPFWNLKTGSTRQFCEKPSQSRYVPFFRLSNR